MKPIPFFPARLTAAIVLGLGAALSSCDRGARDRFHYRLEAPAEWRTWSGPAPVVPGKLLEAFEVPAGESKGSLAVFQSPYLPATTVPQLLTQRRMLLLNLPELKLHITQEIQISGQPAALIDLTAEGTGKAISPTGLGKPIPPAGEKQAPTRRLWVIVPRSPELGTLEVFFHCPETEYPRLKDTWEKLLKSFQL